MKKLLLIVLVLLCAAQAYAWTPRHVRDVSIKRGAKISPTPNELFSSSGDLPIDYIIIPGLPYTAQGNSCDGMDLLDVSCPYSGSTSPEAIFSYTPMVNKHIGLDLCESDFDTKIFVLDIFGNVIGCNDDFYFELPCYEYSSFLDVELSGGVQYLIVIDGYGGECGDYVLNIDYFESCIGDSEPNGMTEGEPIFDDNYYDSYNGGCYFEPYATQLFNWTSLGAGDCGYLNGVTGWYVNNDTWTMYYDTDWFEVVAAGETIDVALSAEIPMFVSLISASCDSHEWLLDAFTEEECGQVSASAQVIPGQTYWIFVEPYDDGGDPSVMYNYTLEVCGHVSEVLPTQAKSWGELKEIYR